MVITKVNLEQLMTVSEAAQLVGVSAPTIHRYLASKPSKVEKDKIKWFQLGKSFLVDQPSVLACAIIQGWIREI